MKTKARKYLLLTGLIVALVAIGYVNFALSGSPSGTAMATPSPKASGALSAGDLSVMSGSFEEYKANRENRRDTEIAYLDSIISNAKSDSEQIKEAQAQKMDIVKAMESELKLEGLLVAAGFKDAIVTVQAGSVNVVLKASEITQEQAAQVLEIVQKQTGEKPQNIKIIMQK